MVNLELYRVFYTVAKCGSLTKAAELLYISQPAVSQAVKQLETQLGTSLFNRTHRGMELTSQGGEQIFKSVEKALFLLENAENRIAELKTSPTGTIRIGASDTIFSYILADRIIEFNRTYPAVKFDLLMGTSVDTIEQIKTNKVDVGFLNLPIADPDIVITSSVQELNDIFVAGEKFSFLKGREMRLEELQEYPLLMLDTNTVTRKAIINFSHSVGVHLHPEVECGSLELMIQLAKNGVGIACVPKEYVRRELSEDKTLVEIRTEPALPARSIGIAFPKNQPVSYATKEFFKLFNKAL